MQITLEKEADFLLKARENNQKIIVHLEFQSSRDRKMIGRMMLYYAILWNKYELPVRQYVVYFGKKNSRNMVDTFASFGMQFKYTLINLWEYDADPFLQSDQPEEVILAVLTDFKDRSPDKILTIILNKLWELTKQKGGFEKYTAQLHILSQLRNLQEETYKIISTMPLKIDIRKDPFFKEGKEEGKAEGRAEGKVEGKVEGELKKLHEIIEHFIINFQFDDETIADFTKAEVSVVKQIRKELCK